MKKMVLWLFSLGMVGCWSANSGYLAERPTAVLTEAPDVGERNPLEILEQKSLEMLTLKRENKELQVKLTMALANHERLLAEQKALQSQLQELQQQYAQCQSNLEMIRKRSGMLEEENLALQIKAVQLEQQWLKNQLKEFQKGELPWEKPAPRRKKKL